ncbi:MAG: hypothetical protein Q8880_13085, partial [Bacteroidota bacterium]|nr:hypothetical protein [Bacteroidota bacterium]
MFYKLKRKTLLTICKFITAAVYIPVYSIYLLPLKFLPYYEYFCNFRKLSFIRNAGNTFDHLNAPQVDFISRERIEKWFSNDEFENICFNHYKKVSWSASGTKK